MKNTTFILIFCIIFLLYTLADYYIFIRGVQAFSPGQPGKRIFGILLFSVSYLFFAGFFLEHGASSAFSEWVYRIGTTWLAVMLYLLLIILAIDLIRLFDWIFGFLPAFSPTARFRLGLSAVALTGLIVLGGYINARWVNIKTIPLSIHKKVAGTKEMKILMASDIHLGALTGERREKYLIDIIRQQKPDLVLLCGDLLDGEIAPVIRKNLGKHIQEIDVPCGVYAITGNHEYIGGIGKTLPYLKSINLRVLCDEVVTLPNGVQLAGRNDHSAGRREGGQMPLDSLLSGTDPEKPLIVMNHQPYNLGEAARAGVDLHLSGHTHHGQMWPFNYITKAIFELSWGYMKKGDTHFYVSSGFGTWGPPVRTGNRPEVVVFNVSFD